MLIYEIKVFPFYLFTSQPGMVEIQVDITNFPVEKLMYIYQGQYLPSDSCLIFVIGGTLEK